MFSSNNQPFNTNNVDTTPSSRTIMVPFQEFSPQNPPPYRQVNGVPIALRDAMSIIASTLINKINKVSTTSVVFCFLYNRVTLNGMQNAEWQKVLEAVVYHTWYNINSRKYPDEPSALNDACQSVIMVYGSWIAGQTPEMQYLLSVQQQNEVRECAKRWPMFTEQYDILAAEAQKAQSGPRGMQNSFASTQNVSAAWSTPGRPQVGNGVGGLTDMAPSATYTAPGQDLTQVKQHNSFYDQPTTPTSYRPSRREMFIPGINDKQARPVQQEPKTPPKASFLSHVTEIANGTIKQYNHQSSNTMQTTAKHWGPSNLQPYHPGYRFNQDVVYELDIDNNGMKRVIAILQVKEQEMDPSKHDFTSSASLISMMQGVPKAQTELSVSYALTTTAKAILSGEIGENEEATQLYRKLGIVDNEPMIIEEVQTSLKAAIAEARGNQILRSDDHLMTFLVRASVATSIASTTSHRDIVKQLQGHSLLSAAGWLKTMLDDIKAHLHSGNIGKLQFLLGIDRLIKRELLSVINFRMGIGNDFSFDSFIEDEKELEKALQSVHGVSYSKAYNAVQPTLLPIIFDEENISEFAITDHLEKAVGYITRIAPTITLLLLSISDEQLGLQLPNDAVCEVFEDTFPGLHEFISSIVQTNPGVLHHYIVTNDDVVYEVNVGLVGTQHMVLTRIPVGI